MPYLGNTYTKKCICCVSGSQGVASEQARKDSQKGRDKIIPIFLCDARLVLPFISRENTFRGIILLIFKREREEKCQDCLELSYCTIMMVLLGIRVNYILIRDSFEVKRINPFLLTFEKRNL